MAQKLTTLFPKPDATAGADHKNYEGAPSFTHGLADQALRLLTTGTFEDTFYAKAQDQAKESLAIFEQMGAKDPELFAKMIVFARSEGLLRTVPITALAVLSKHNPILFRLIFPRVIRTPGDLQDFVTLVRKTGIRGGLGRSVDTAINTWLNAMSEYHAIKYGSQGADLSLRDILRLTHPRPGRDVQDVLFNYLINGLTPDNSNRICVHLPQVWAFECLKKAETDETQRKLVKIGRLPHEVVTGAIKPSVEMWEELMGQMPFFALLRHLNTLHKHGILKSPVSVDHVVSVLTDAKRVQKSMVLPFRYYTAYKAVATDMPRPIQEALEIALELSFDNVPELPGKVCVGSDVSGSMGSPVSEKGTTRYIDICGIFTAAVLRKSADAIVLPFDGIVRENIKFSRRDTLMATTEKLARICGGATAVGAPAAWLYDRKIKVDTFIGITDGEDWAQARWGGRGQGFGNIWREYRRVVNPSAQAYLLTLSPYQNWMTKDGEPGVHYVYGWSDAVASYVIQQITGKQSQMDAVRAISLHSGPNGLVDLVETE